MGEYIFSIFVGVYFAAVGLFMNRYLKKEMERNTAEKAGGANS
jgi:hypothetical protein